jgi:hypothetical protein
MSLIWHYVWRLGHVPQRDVHFVCFLFLFYLSNNEAHDIYDYQEHGGYIQSKQTNNHIPLFSYTLTK